MRRRTFVLSGLVFFALAATGCGSDEATAFAPGLQPLEEVTAPAPTATATDPYPEVLVMRSGHLTAYDWAHGHAYVHAPIARVYEALRDPEVNTDRRRVDEFTTTNDSEPDYPFSYRVHNVVNDVVTLEFDVSYRLGPLAGSEAVPTSVGLRYQKTFGSSFIDLMSGSAVARQVNADVTELEIVRHLKSISTNASDTEAYVRDMYASLLARVRGQPLPSY